MEAWEYEIDIKKIAGFPSAKFRVTVKGETRTVHEVSLSEEYYRSLGEGEVPPEKLILFSFQFLLRREPNTAILSQFSLSDIARYFPEYEKVVRTAIARGEL
ncbi:hypothetical protein D6779_11935 [Candidatus Parcubacteria bacterium]|nr:MAG: hypothetical protein D6779_11935 [Candidatus Parcubacteria bacterium]